MRIDRPSGRPDEPDRPGEARQPLRGADHDDELRDDNGLTPAEYIHAYNEKLKAERASEAEKASGQRRDPALRDSNGMTAAELRFQHNRRVDEAEASADTPAAPEPERPEAEQPEPETPEPETRRDSVQTDAQGRTGAEIRFQEAKAANEREHDERAQDQLERLPIFQRRDPTRGFWTDRDGTEHELISGRDEYTPKVDELAVAEEIGPRPHQLAIAKHVEAKFAMRMRELGLTDESITINNRPCFGELGCDERLPQLLPAGSSLTVYAPENFKKTYRSTETDQEGTRS